MSNQKILLVNPIAKKKKPRTAKQRAATKKLIAFNKAKRKKAAPPKVKRSKPSPKKRSTSMAARKRRTAAQRAATKKLVALNRRRAAGSTKRRRKNPIAARANGSTTAKRRAYRATSTMRAPARRQVRVRRRRKNPIGGTGLIGRTFNNVVIPAISATGGALALDLMLGYLPIPLNWKVGPVKWLTKALGAVVLTEAAGLVVSKKTAQNMGLGALTVVMHEAAKAEIVKRMPTIKMDGIGYYSPALPSAGYSDGMGLYTNTRRARGMGLYTNANRAPSMGLYTNYGGEGEMNAEQFEPQH